MGGSGTVIIWRMSMATPLDLRILLLKQIGLKPGECAGKVVVVTGGGQGIGLQAARAFAALGGIVVIAEISKVAGKAAEALINGEGGKAIFVQTDVADAYSVKRLALAVHSIFGPVDFLLNGAIRWLSAPVMEMNEGDWDQLLAVNLRGTFLINKIFLPEMIERKTGVIINLVSTDLLPGMSAFGASRQGVLGFSLALALEAGPMGVKVIALDPGMVDTPGLRSILPDLAPRLGMTPEQFLRKPPHSDANGGMLPAEIAGAITVYLALRLADRAHGQLVKGSQILELVGLTKPAPISPFTTPPDV